jgi:hypothetical protein
VARREGISGLAGAGGFHQRSIKTPVLWGQGGYYDLGVLGIIPPQRGRPRKTPSDRIRLISRLSWMPSPLGSKRVVSTQE